VKVQSSQGQGVISNQLTLSDFLPTPDDSRIPFFLLCPLETTDLNPISVSLVTKPCDTAENNLRVIDNQPLDGVQKEFGVCTKQISFKSRNFVFKFVEWVHMLKILGVEKIHGYNRFVHRDTIKAFEYFEQKGWLEIQPFLEPQGSPFELTSWPTRAIERNLLNDCFYRNKNLYKYIAVIDTDEVFMPVGTDIRNYSDLIASFGSHEKFDCFQFPYVYFSMSNESHQIPNHHQMLQFTKVVT
jgi:hypothetical protein